MILTSIGDIGIQLRLCLTEPIGISGRPGGLQACFASWQLYYDVKTKTIRLHHFANNGTSPLAPARIPGTAAGYHGVIWHLYSDNLDANWQKGGIALNTSAEAEAWDSYGVFTPSIAWEGAGGKVVPAQTGEVQTWFLVMATTYSTFMIL